MYRHQPTMLRPKDVLKLMSVKDDGEICYDPPIKPVRAVRIFYVVALKVTGVKSSTDGGIRVINKYVTMVSNSSEIYIIFPTKTDIKEHSKSLYM